MFFKVDLGNTKKSRKKIWHQIKSINIKLKIIGLQLELYLSSCGQAQPGN